MDRREFLAASALASIALCTGCGSGSNDPTGPAISTGSTIKISDHPELANVGGVATFSLGGTPIAVVRTSASAFVALSRICPHQGSVINKTGSGFLCSGHGATFTQTGTWTGGERTSNMRSFATTFDSAAGTLKIG